METDEEESNWWKHLPMAPAVTRLLLRQQTRRRWKPFALSHMMSRLPGLLEMHYEPWREWYIYDQQQTDSGQYCLLLSQRFLDFLPSVP